MAKIKKKKHTNVFKPSIANPIEEKGKMLWSQRESNP